MPIELLKCNAFYRRTWSCELSIWQCGEMLGVGRSERGSGGNRITSHATQTSLTGWCSSLRWRCSNIIYYWDRLSAEQWKHTAEHLKWWWPGDLVYACVIFVWLWMVPQSQPTKGWQPLRWKGVTPHWVDIDTYWCYAATTQVSSNGAP